MWKKQQKLTLVSSNTINGVGFKPWGGTKLLSYHLFKGIRKIRLNIFFILQQKKGVCHLCNHYPGSQKYHHWYLICKSVVNALLCQIYKSIFLILQKLVYDVRKIASWGKWVRPNPMMPYWGVAFESQLSGALMTLSTLNTGSHIFIFVARLSKPSGFYCDSISTSRLCLLETKACRTCITFLATDVALC